MTVPREQAVALLVDECLADSDPAASDMATAVRHANALIQRLGSDGSLEPVQEQALLARADETWSVELRAVLSRLLMASALNRGDVCALEALIGRGDVFLRSALGASFTVPVPSGFFLVLRRLGEGKTGLLAAVAFYFLERAFATKSPLTAADLEWVGRGLAMKPEGRGLQRVDPAERALSCLVEIIAETEGELHVVARSLLLEASQKRGKEAPRVLSALIEASARRNDWADLALHMAEASAAPLTIVKGLSQAIFVRTTRRARERARPEHFAAFYDEMHQLLQAFGREPTEHVEAAAEATSALKRLVDATRPAVIVSGRQRA